MKSKQIDIDKLIGEMRQYPNQPALQKAVCKYLGPEAEQWWEHRQKNRGQRLVNERTMEMVSQFQANGNEYYIVPPDDRINVKRMTKLKQILSITYRDQNFAEQLQFVSKLIGYANSLVTKEPKLDMLFATLKGEKERLESTKRRTWDYSLLACTFFIVRPDEDMKKWNEQDANKKIEDWSAEGIPEEDFFLCAILWGSLFAQRRKALIEAARQLAEQKHA